MFFSRPRAFIHPWRALLFVALFVAPGCPARPSARALPPLERTVSADPRAEADFRAASEARAEGRLEEAHQRFRAFIEVWRDDPLEPYARLELGMLDLERGKNQEARSWFEGVAKTRDPALSERGRLYGAVATQRLGDHQQALFVLRELVGRTVDPRETLLVYDTIAQAEEAIGDDLSALETRDRQLSVELSEAQRRDVERHVQEIVDRLDPALELPRAYETLPRKGFAWPVVARRLLAVAHARGERERVQEIAAALDREGETLDEELRGLVMRAERSSDADPGVVGAILPLSGRGREVGEAALHGLMLASQAAAEGKGPRLVYRDDMGDPQRAREALDDLVAMHRVIAVIGPVTTASAQAVATRARELAVPVIALSPDPSLTERPGTIYRVLPEPREESAALVRHAMGQGARRFALLAPENNFGHTMRAAYEAAVGAQGGTFVGAVTYPTTATSFMKEAEAVAKLGFDAVVIADGPNRVALIAPALAARGVWSARESRASATEHHALFLVPSIGFDPSLARTSRRYLQQAVFSVPFDASRAPGFVESFRTAFQNEPNLFAAAAHDAYRLLGAALASGAQTRSGVDKALKTVRLNDAVGAADGFAPGGGPRRPTRLETLNGDAFVELATN